LKGIDFDLFESLDGAIAKRLYRFLDKRFWHRDHLEFHLKEMAWEHIGLAPSYDTAIATRTWQNALNALVENKQGLINVESWPKRRIEIATRKTKPLRSSQKRPERFRPSAIVAPNRNSLSKSFPAWAANYMV